MRKFLLVVFVGIVLAINLYGLVNNIIGYLEAREIEEQDPGVNKGYVTVIYVE